MNRRSRVAMAHTSPATTSADGMSRISIALLSTFEAMTSIMTNTPAERPSEASAQGHQRIAADPGGCVPAGGRRCGRLSL